MLMKYNDGETTFILQFNGELNVDDIDYINDVTETDHQCVAYMKDGESNVHFHVVVAEASIEQPNLVEL